MDTQAGRREGGTRTNVTRTKRVLSSRQQKQDTNYTINLKTFSLLLNCWPEQQLQLFWFKFLRIECYQLFASRLENSWGSVRSCCRARIVWHLSLPAFRVPEFQVELHQPGQPLSTGEWTSWCSGTAFPCLFRTLNTHLCREAFAVCTILLTFWTSPI